MRRVDAIRGFHDELLASRQGSLASGQDGFWLDGWGSAEGQHARFDALLRSANYHGGSVVDFGCGTGALRAFLAGRGYPFTYLGLDMNPHLLPVSGEFRLIDFDAVDFPPADYVFASGVFQFADEGDPLYYRRLVGALFERCSIALSVNFLSAMRDEGEKDPEELYLTPGEAVELAASLSGRWVLDHSYHPARGDLTVSVHASVSRSPSGDVCSRTSR
jgi:SAM-dependent methyltransferase